MAHACFGVLRDAEVDLLKERLLNYALFKVVFLGAILEPDMAELLVWSSCFAFLGLLRLLGGLARDR